MERLGVLTLLALAFFTLVFSSLLWLIYAVRFISDSLAGISFFDAGIVNILLYALLVCLPIFLFWAVFGYINQYINNKSTALQLRKLMAQMKKNQDYSDLLARVLIETEQHINDGFILSKFDLLIADMNELLSEIIKGCKLASSEQIESLWAKVQNGGKWSFGKVIIEVNNSQPNFKKRVLNKAGYDIVLGGTIMEFCARYQAVVKMLENHDNDKLFLDMIETGVMGKVYSILAPVASEIQYGREHGSGFNSRISEAGTESALPEIKLAAKETIATKDEETNDGHGQSFLKKINIFNRKEHSEEISQASEAERDPFSIALERSFSDDEPEAPRLSTSPEEDIINDVPNPQVSFPKEKEERFEPKFETEMTDTQKTLDDLKKEWTENRQILESDTPKNAESEIDENSLAYPFGSWADEQNYKK